MHVLQKLLPVQDQQIIVDNGKITEYRVIMKVTFILND
ncbi:MAG: dodecin domain-containing protein [Thiotrichales bacterium]|nr:dodecin domain-containing protein [Thiotrichales bacterium]